MRQRYRGRETVALQPSRKRRGRGSDSAGIPHVTARDFGSLGYGEGYAFAQDNLCSLADAIVTVRAQRSRFFGPDALADTRPGRIGRCIRYRAGT